MKKLIANLLNAVTHAYGGLSRKYYAEDFMRVYPDGLRFDRLGRKRQPNPRYVKNYLNHKKFYAFAAQFAKNVAVADIGCGSGYGSQILIDAGASRFCGADASKAAIEFASEHFGQIGEFTVQGITDMNLFAANQFGLTICSEVLEHIKEYGKEDLAVAELKRITQPGGVLVVGTPNNELDEEHGYSFDEIDALFKRHFTRYVVFENALLPFGSRKELWERRLASVRTGVILSEKINLDETVVPDGVTPEIKQGEAPGVRLLGDRQIDTTLLHNTHSWAVVAIKDTE